MAKVALPLLSSTEMSSDPSLAEARSMSASPSRSAATTHRGFEPTATRDGTSNDTPLGSATHGANCRTNHDASAATEPVVTRVRVRVVSFVSVDVNMPGPTWSSAV